MESEPLSAVELTRILREWSAGEASALERLAPVVYAELHRIAARNMARERDGHLLQPSALVNEAYLRLVAGEPVEWNSRTHFFAYSARLMRQILVDFARAQQTERRGGARRQQADVSSIREQGAGAARPVDFLDLDRALAAGGGITLFWRAGRTGGSGGAGRFGGNGGAGLADCARLAF
jgi:RNA polymerase sigma-70 factor, ECF subfamily